MSNLAHYLIYLIVRGVSQLIGWLPMSLVYLLAYPLYFTLAHLLHYRHKVIQDNLQRVFPQWSKTKRDQVQRSFYGQFADMLVESIKGLSLSAAELRRRYHYENPELIDQLAKRYGGVWLLGGHYANWEWGVQSFPLWVTTPVLGIFKPVNNRFIDRWLQRRRCRFGLHLAAMSQVGRYIVGDEQPARIYVLIADQMPSDSQNAIQAELLGTPTHFLHGPEKLARRTGYPVAHFRIQRKKRGYYQITFEVLSEQPTELSPGVLTQHYATAIGQTISQAPESWLWSHRRWKWS